MVHFFLSCILYNWYAVNDPRGLAPNGWDIPSISQFQKLIATSTEYTLGGGEFKVHGLFLDKFKLSQSRRTYNGTFSNSIKSNFWTISSGWKNGIYVELNNVDYYNHFERKLYVIGNISNVQ